MSNIHYVSKLFESVDGTKYLFFKTPSSFDSNVIIEAIRIDTEVQSIVKMYHDEQQDSSGTEVSMFHVDENESHDHETVVEHGGSYTLNDDPILVALMPSTSQSGSGVGYGLSIMEDRPLTVIEPGENFIIEIINNGTDTSGDLTVTVLVDEPEM